MLLFRLISLVALFLLLASSAPAQVALGPSSGPCIQTGDYPYQAGSCLNATALNADLELSPGGAPPTNVYGRGAGYGKLWIDTSVSPAHIRMCTVQSPGLCSTTYNASQWADIGVIDQPNGTINLSTGGGLASIPSSGVIDLGLYPQSLLQITGTATINSFGTTLPAGKTRVLVFEGSLTITNSPSAIVIPGGNNITTQPGGMALVTSQGNGLYSLLYQPQPTGGLTPIANNSVLGNVSGGSAMPGQLTPTQLAGMIGLAPQVTAQSLAVNPNFSVNSSGSISQSGPPSLQRSTGSVPNNLATLVSVYQANTTGALNEREFNTVIDFHVTSGLAGTPASAQDKVAFVPTIQVSGSNAGNAWTENPMLWLDGTLAVPTGHHQISEMDLANGYKDVDPTLGPNGMQYPNASAGAGNIYTYGLVLESTGFKNTAAIVIAGGSQWHRGVGCDNTNAIDQACIYDYSTSPTTLDLWGTHTYGVDMLNATFSAAALRLPNGADIVSRNAAGTSDTILLALDSSNNVHVGPTGLAITPAGIVLVSGLQAPSTTWTNTGPCMFGQIAWDTNYIYVCTATNTVKRVALSTF